MIYKPYFKQINTMPKITQSDFDKLIFSLLKRNKIDDNHAIKLIENASMTIRKRNRERINNKVAGRELVDDDRPDLVTMKEN